MDVVEDEVPHAIRDALRVAQDASPLRPGQCALVLEGSTRRVRAAQHPFRTLPAPVR